MARCLATYVAGWAFLRLFMDYQDRLDRDWSSQVGPVDPVDVWATEQVTAALASGRVQAFTEGELRWIGNVAEEASMGNLQVKARAALDAMGEGDE